jgi:hypothetical protein
MTVILSIHDRDELGALAFDLKEVLALLPPVAKDWRWCIRRLEATGEEAEELDRRRREAGGWLWLGFSELTEVAASLDQTLDAMLMAYPSDFAHADASAVDLSLRNFPGNAMQMAITAVDGGRFVLFAKDRELLEPLHEHFRDARWEEARTQFR